MGRRTVTPAHRQYRFDRSAELCFDDAPASPTRSRAELTPEGYLVVDAYIARDGLLRYTAQDGTSWIEYRPRVELERSASSWVVGTPVTDNHPKVMVSSATWSSVARGMHVESARVEIVDGIAYLRTRLQITDRALVAKISGEGGAPPKTQISIGFATDVVPCPTGKWTDGTRCDAVQLNLIGNHTAVVDRGRAGPTVRILDALGEARDYPWYNNDARPISDSEITVKHKQRPAVKPVTIKTDGFDASKVDLSNVKLDEAGAPTDEVEILGPDGNPVTVPTWVAAALAEWQAHKAQQAMQAAQPQAPAPPMADAPSAPVTPSPSPAAPEVKPDDKPKQDSMDPQTIADNIRARARLERLAAKAGVSDETIDRSDDAELRAAYVERVLDKSELAALRVRLDDEQIVEVAAARKPVAAPAPAAPSPYGAPRPVTRTSKRDADPNDEIDPLVLAEAEHYMREGIE